MPLLRMLHFLMLMALLCDADDTCPGLNPLVLVPSEVIAEYGSEVLVNCSSSYEDHDGMYWSNEKSAMKEDETFILRTLLLSDWNVAAKCIIKMNKSLECSKDLKITLFKNPVNIGLYSLTDPVAETEFALQCDVHDVAPVQHLTVKWYKDNELIRTESFLNTSKTPMTESSLLRVNISRGDKGAEFRCEAQLDFGPNGPKPLPISQTKVISVQYAPELSNNTAHVYLREGEDVTLSCGAEGNPPPIFHWTRDGVDMMENTKNLSVTRVNVSAIYNCTASNHLGRINKYISIHVIKDVMGLPAMTTPGPREVCPLTLTPGEVVVRFGDRASVNCSTSATDASTMGWEASDRGTGPKDPPSVTWTVEKLKDWFMKPKCFINLTDGHQCSAVPKITLYKTPDVVSVSAVTQGPMVEGVPYELRCDIISVAPVRNLSVTLSFGEEKVSEEMVNHTSPTPDNVTFSFSMKPRRDHNGTLLRCNAELHLGPKGPDTIPTISSEPYTAVVHYKPTMQDCPTHFTGVEHNFRLEMLPCKADGNPPPIVRWYYEGKLINPSEPLSRAQSGKYTAEVFNELSSTNTSVDITFEFAPEFREGNLSQEVIPGQNVTFACSAEGNPVPKIQWNFSAVENARETTGGRQKNVSVTGATSTNAGVYICVATNKVGSVSRFVTLGMRDRGLIRGRPLSILWVLLILCFLALLLIVMITLCKRRKKHGQYSFIPAAKEGSDIPLTTTSGGDKD